MQRIETTSNVPGNDPQHLGSGGAGGEEKNIAPQAQILSPASGISVDLGGVVNALPFEGIAFDNEDADCCALEWKSNLDGFMGNRPNIDHIFKNAGTHTITLTATDNDSAKHSSSVIVEVVNEGPEVEMTSPAPGSVFVLGETASLEAIASDFSEPLGFPCASYVWSSSNPDDPFPQTGCGVSASFPTTGARTLTVTVADSEGAHGEASVHVEVILPKPSDLPTITMTSPNKDNMMINPYTSLFLGANSSSQVSGLKLVSWSLEFYGQTHKLQPSFFGFWQPASTVGSYCGALPVTLTVEISDPNGTATHSRPILLGFPPC